MAGSRGTCLYKEARLNIEPAFPGSTIHITLPVQDNSTFGNRPQPKRTVLSEQHSDRDEDAFTRRHLASDGSMYFRKHHQYPRSFLWRLLDNRKLLEIQSTDLDHDEAHKVEANVTILLRFASPVRPFCIAFADPEERDALTVFAITSANEFYTITLHRDFFTKPSASEQEVSDWCRLSLPTQLQIRIPYRLVAQSSSELLVTLDNGGILWLTKTNKDDITWNEAVFLETSWSGSMRGLLTWTREQKVRFDNGDLDVSAAAAVAKSPDGKHLLSVCLNHKLRAWNLQTGRPGVQVDLLGEPDRPNDEGASYIVGPAQPNLMAVVDIQGGVDGTVYYVVTYSPKQHQFKFWGIRDADEVEQGIYDVKPDFEFIPPVDELMDTTAWTLAEFFINPGPGPSRWRGAELWIRARSGPSSKVYSLRFNLKDEPSKLASTWKNGWLSVDSGPLSVEQLRKNPTNPGEQDLELSELYQGDVTERWLDFLFYPGRFTTATLEAALLVFQRGLERAKTPRSVSTGSLKERISATVGTFAVLGQNGVTSQDGYQDTLAAQWQAFYSLVKDLHKRRGEHLSLAFDYESNMPWLVLSDYLSAIRLCSDAETVALNSSALASPRGLSGPLRKSIADPQDRNVARLLNAAASFRKSLPRPFQSRLQDELANELLQSRSLSVVDRMELLEANCNLSQLVTDDDLSALVEELGSDVRELTTKTFMRAITLLKQQEQGAVVEPKRQVARFGLNALVRVSQEILDLNKNVLLDLLVLILFMQYEEELSDEFDASAVFVEIICELKDNAVLSWLASMVWSNPAPTGPSSITLLSSLTATSKNRKPASFNQTVLEGVLGYKAFEVPMPKGLQTELLTYWSRVWLALAFKEDYAVSLETIMGILLSQGEYELAFKFSKFLPVTTWATYLRGRMYLALGDNALASICFQKPAYKLGKWYRAKLG
jgi:DNA repair protein RAD51/nuclear pore complex protein Nup160